MAPEATVFFKRLASMIAEKCGESYSSTMGWLRCVIGFCLLRASLTCIRSSRSMTGIGQQQTQTLLKQPQWDGSVKVINFLLAINRNNTEQISKPN